VTRGAVGEYPTSKESLVYSYKCSVIELSSDRIESLRPRDLIRPEEAPDIRAWLFKNLRRRHLLESVPFFPHNKIRQHVEVDDFK
jgi:hypothetical protein